MKSACISMCLILLVILTSSFNSSEPTYHLAGIWESEEKNLQIEMFEVNGEFAGRMIYFKCSTDEIMRTCKDIENPDRELVDRNLLGLTLVTDLQYHGDNIWDDGKIYDPNSGRTFEARIHLTGPQSAIVRGYWKFRWLGRSMAFHRKK
ncbi:MAG TPA: DUF2147 domain-containing protein [Chryseolinea sp.]